MTLNPDRELAFPATAAAPSLPARGLLAAAGFDLKPLRRAAPPGLADRSPLWGGLTRLAADDGTADDGTAGGGAFLAGPVLGAPMAVMALEELSRRGAREIVFVGLAGSLTAELGPGDLFCPEAGLSTEGTSGHYPAAAIPDAGLRNRILVGDPGGGIAGGTVWSTDAPFRETAGLTAAQRAAGAAAVEMETTALWAAAAFRGVRLAALLVISDVLTEEGRHITGFRAPRFKAGLTRAAELAWRAVTDVC
jgi:purine-nucleoside phosphorylase